MTEKKIKTIVQQHIGKVRQRELNIVYRYVEKNNINIKYTKDKRQPGNKFFIKNLNLLIQKIF